MVQLLTIAKSLCAIKTARAKAHTTIDKRKKLFTWFPFSAEVAAIKYSFIVLPKLKVKGSVQFFL